jgi:transcriptional regulator with XRE-family HTH domain
MQDTNFARWRRSVGFTQSQAAEALGVDIRTVKDYEAAKREPPLAVRKIMRAYSVGVYLEPWQSDPIPRSASKVASFSRQEVGMKRFFEICNAPLHNYRWSWGARIQGAREAYLLRAWADRVETSDGGPVVGLYHPDLYRRQGYSSPGIDERHTQLLAIMNGKQGWCVLCEAVDTNAIPRKIARFDDVFYPIRRIAEDQEGNITGTLGKPVKYDEYISLTTR